jgi:hypothetical protein
VAVYSKRGNEDSDALRSGKCYPDKQKVSGFGKDTVIISSLPNGVRSATIST